MIKKHKTSIFDLTSQNQCFKEFNTIIQPILLLKELDIFCIKYNILEGCSFCQYQDKRNLYYKPYIEISLDEIKNNLDLELILTNKFKNNYSYCNICGYDINGQIIDSKNPSHYYVLIEKFLPDIIILIFEFTESIIQNSGKFNYNENDLNYNLRLHNINNILAFMRDEIKLNNKIYYLGGIINTPFANHFSGTIINLKLGMNSLKEKNNYYYDDYSNNGEVILCDRVNNLLKNNIPYGCIYLLKK